MITREEYNKALDVIEAYQKQLFSANMSKGLKNRGKTKIEDWVELPKCSIRLQNALSKIKYYDLKGEKIKFIEDIKEEVFLKQKLVGWKTWREFVLLRGY